MSAAVPTMIVRYRELIARPLDYAKSLAAFAGLAADARVRGDAANVITERQ